MAAKYCLLVLVLCAAQINAEIQSTLELALAKLQSACVTINEKVTDVEDKINTTQTNFTDNVHKKIDETVKKGVLLITNNDKIINAAQTAAKSLLTDCIIQKVNEVETSVKNIVATIDDVCKTDNPIKTASAVISAIAIISAESIKLTTLVPNLPTALVTCEANVFTIQIPSILKHLVID